MNLPLVAQVVVCFTLLVMSARDVFAADKVAATTTGKPGIEAASRRDENRHEARDENRHEARDENRHEATDIADSPGVELVRQHLAELLPLLSHLRVHEPGQYAKAVRELDRAAKRLESQQRRGSELFDVALRQWQSRARIDLLKAKLRVRPSESDRKRLLAEMRALREVEVERLRLELEIVVQRQQALTARMAQAEAAAKRAGEQMEELNQNIQRLTSQPIDSDWPVYRRAAGLDRESDPAKKPNKPETPQPNRDAKAFGSN